MMNQPPEVLLVAAISVIVFSAFTYLVIRSSVVPRNRYKAFLKERESTFEEVRVKKKTSNSFPWIIGKFEGREVEILIVDSYDFTISFAVPPGPKVKIKRRRPRAGEQRIHGEFEDLFEVSIKSRARDSTASLPMEFRSLLTSYAREVNDAISVKVSGTTWTMEVNGKPALKESDAATFDRAVALVRAYAPDPAIDRPPESDDWLVESLEENVNVW
jgi:hypothetical protein